FVVAFDSGNATASQRLRIYVNGVQYSFASNPIGSNDEYFINTTDAHFLGAPPQLAEFFPGYLADIHFINGQALDPTSFGEFDATTGVWNPKAYTGTYGTNGFHLDFADNSSNTASTLGKDTSGNSPANNWTPNNLSVVSSYSTVVSNIASAGTTWGNINNAFDGNTGTYADGTGNNGTVSTITFNKPLTGVTLLEYYWGGTSTYGYNSTNVGTGPSSSSPGYVTAYSGSAITINNLRAVSQPGDGVVRVYAIRVNGTVLTGYTEGNPAGNDSLVDVPTNGAQTDTGVGGEVRGNYCTLNPLGNGSSAAPTSGLSNGNLQHSGSTTGGFPGTFAIPVGKWYWEVTLEAITAPFVGICNDSRSLTADPGITLTNEYGFYFNPTINYMDGSSNPWSTGSVSNGDVIGVAVDATDYTNVKLWLSKNNTWYSNGGGASGNPGAGTNAIQTITTNKTLYPFCAIRGVGSSTMQANFGQRPFAYTAPSGFKALCTTNLPAPLVTKPNTVMDVVLYTGNNSTQSITSLAFNPDMVWSKCRNVGRSHRLSDAIRGSNVDLYTDTTASDNYYGSGSITAFTANGFNLDNSPSSQYNTSGETYVSWCWDAGTSTVSNTQGSITSQVRANVTAGFSIVSWTGNGTLNASVGHGLGVLPKLRITKNRTTGGTNWPTHTTVIDGSLDFLSLNTTAAKGDSGENTDTSSVFHIYGDTAYGASGQNYITYCFAPVVGYSSFGSYTGNGS
ncbi:hypothetical protein EBZ39_14700, partial [bacterium]|nr:hypothetical protein [bacterium]